MARYVRIVSAPIGAEDSDWIDNQLRGDPELTTAMIIRRAIRLARRMQENSQAVRMRGEDRDA